MKSCTKCGELKELTGFSTDRSAADGRNHLCRACRCSNAAEWRRANPYRVRLTKYRSDDKARGHSNDLTEAFIASHYHLPCDYCGSSESNGLDRLDNSLGHLTSNVVPCCYECNRIRSNVYTPAQMKILGAALQSLKQCQSSLTALKPQ